MKKTLTSGVLTILLAFLFCGCDKIGDKSLSMAVVYIATTVLSLLLLIGYCTLLKKKDTWFITLFACIFIVNVGYLSLSLSQTLEEALLANRISYLGSVILPLSMLMIIKNSCNIKYSNTFTGCLIALSIAVFLIAASPGYLDIYYKSVSLDTINGVSVLNKEYGSWHCIYLFYLLGYFTAMISTIIYAVIKRKIKTPLRAIIIASAVFVNIGVWLMEQLVKFDFEFLSVSYIVSGLFLLSIYLLEQESESIFKANTNTSKKDIAENILPVNDIAPSSNNTNTKITSKCEDILDEKQEYFLKQLLTLTATEKKIYNLHIERKTSKEIMLLLNIKENTLKYHNRNIYSKLGVSSKKELCEIVNTLNNK